LISLEEFKSMYSASKLIEKNQEDTFGVTYVTKFDIFTSMLSELPCSTLLKVSHEEMINEIDFGTTRSFIDGFTSVNSECYNYHTMSNVTGIYVKGTLHRLLKNNENDMECNLRTLYNSLTYKDKQYKLFKDYFEDRLTKVKEYSNIRRIWMENILRIE